MLLSSRILFLTFWYCALPSCHQNFPLSKMISSTQTCNYNFDNKKHISRGVCTETHMYMPLPFQ